RERPMQERILRAVPALILSLILPLSARAEDLGGQKEFRDIFFSLLQQDVHMSPENAHKLLYALPDELRNPPVGTFGEGNMHKVDALFAKWRPSQLYQLGSKVPAATVNWTAQFAQGGSV